MTPSGADWNADAALPGLRAVLDPRDRLGTKNDLIHEVSRRAVRHGLRRCGDRRYASAVDFGCGIGRLAPTLLAAADVVVGVDASEQMLERARREHAGARARFVLPDALPPLRNPLLVTFVYVLSQLPDGEAASAVGRLGQLAEPRSHCIVVEKVELRGPRGRAAADLRPLERYLTLLDDAGWRPLGRRVVRHGASVAVRAAQRLPPSLPGGARRLAVRLLAELELALAARGAGSEYADVCIWSERRGNVSTS